MTTSPPPALDDPFDPVAPIWGNDLEPPDDYEPEPHVIDVDVMLITSDPTAIEPQYGTVPCIVTGTGLKEWYG